MLNILALAKDRLVVKKKMEGMGFAGDGFCL
jgi:hypothetical protein